MASAIGGNEVKHLRLERVAVLVLDAKSVTGTSDVRYGQIADREHFAARSVGRVSRVGPEVPLSF
jgi:hypothetical protein